MVSTGATLKLYQSVIDDVVHLIRGSFLDEGTDEQLLLELKSLWENKLENSEAVQEDSSSENESSSEPSCSEAASASATPKLEPGLLPMSTSLQLVVPSDGSVEVPVHITVPWDFDKIITIKVPASCVNDNKLQDILSLPPIQDTLSLPSELAASILQTQVNQALSSESRLWDSDMFSFASTSKFGIGQVDGQADRDDSSEDNEDDEDGGDDDVNDVLDDEDDDISDKDDDENEEKADPEPEDQDEEPLNSGDDVSDAEDANKLFDVDNVLVCQFDKLTKARNKWRFYLKDGIMNMNGKDFIFKKASGDADW